MVKRVRGRKGARGEEDRRGPAGAGPLRFVGEYKTNI
jgi:hypothetical protein